MSFFKIKLAPLCLSLLLLFGILLPSCYPSNKKTKLSPSKSGLEAEIIKEPIKTTQIIIASSNNDNFFEGNLRGMELIEDKWMLTFDSIPCTYGKKGLAKADQKIEGDLKTPSGTFQIGSAFGYKHNLESDINFIELSDHDYWVNDTLSDMYNKFVSYLPEGISAEKMKRSDYLYEYGIIIKYNTQPIVKGKESAIFIHVERKRSSYGWLHRDFSK
ncbi:MAG: hypothetical protein IPP15_16240 [Saprospiraceae bacterium]|uniref:Uncharacterized protein n=1 Tax=Candidatus Opimibacter skivensis TaxID=2982028 RepID=A0A9D7XRB7_9BACT|nr:hypothetical protein [Candidatus Opimibacter skivensis]